MDEQEALSLLWADFRDDLRKRLKYIKCHVKGDQIGDDEGLLWHFTRLSRFRSMIDGRGLWLSDLTRSNDEDEVRFGLRQVESVIADTPKPWKNRGHAELVGRLGRETIDELETRLSLYGFCFSEERDTAHHWGAYGGGLQVRPDPTDPYVALGFDAQALCWPLDLTSDAPPVFLFNTVHGVDEAKHLCQYWVIKARKALEVLDAPKVPLDKTRVYALLKRTLVLACSLVKAEGWRGEHEFRLLYLPDVEEDVDRTAIERPDGRGCYIPLEWKETNLPIKRIMAHPLADYSFVRDSVAAVSDVHVGSSLLKPRALP